MKNSFTLLFFIKKSKADSQSKANIYLRITVNGRRSELSVKRKIRIDKWNSSTHRAKGYSEETIKINQYLDIIQNKIYKIHQNFVEKELPFTAELIRKYFLGVNENNKMLLEIFENHNKQMGKLVGKEFAKATFIKYKTTISHLKNYIDTIYCLNDMPVGNVNHKFITGFEYYLKTDRNCSHNTAIKYVTNLKKIVRIAFANDWINKDPFFNWQAKLKIVERTFLSENEIQKMINKQFVIKRLDQVKDIFIFACFTGLAYADVKKLAPNDVVIGIDGGRWINTKRTKTDTRSNIPILPTVESILEKYKTHPDVVKGDKLLPVLSNQKMNAYLKEIADLCGITKNLTFHLARHTFATTVTLTNGVPIESVSKMLGHKSLRTTQHYAKILDRKVSQDMAALREVLDNKISNQPNRLEQAH